jgi:hypothetical protein
LTDWIYRVETNGRPHGCQEDGTLNIAYADPPYLGKCALYHHEHGTDNLCWDDPETHAGLIHRLGRDYPDGWALSLSATTLRVMLAYCPDDARIGVWVKPFASFKPNVTPAYAWEPVIFRGGRRRGRDEWSGRDWVSAMPPVFSGEARGVPGMKPEAFCFWLFDDLFGLRWDDEFVDLFHGSGAVGAAWQRYRRQRRLFDPQGTGNIPEAPSDQPGLTAAACDQGSGNDGRPERAR